MTPRKKTAPETLAELAVREGRKRLCELIDGVLVEKVMGTRESLLARILLRLLGNFVDAQDLGIVLGGAGILRVFPGVVRIPDAAWQRPGA
jgi:hypothetical protein